MTCNYKLFMGDRVWRTQTGENHHSYAQRSYSPALMDSVLPSPVVVHQSTHYTQDLHSGIPSDWVVHNSPSGYMGRDGRHKYMAHFPSMCCSSPLHPKVLFYDGHESHFDIFDNRSLYIIQRHHIQSFVLNLGDSVHYQPNGNGQNLKLKNLYANLRMNWMRNHGTLNFTLPHMNYVLVEKWEAFKISSKKITHKSFNKTHLLLIPPP